MNTRRQLIATIFGFAALGFALLAIIYWAVILGFSGMDRALQIFLIAAIISFSVFLLAAPETVGQAATRRSNRLTANALVVSLVALGIAFVVNVIAESTPAVRADWTANQTFTLSEQTLNVLKELDRRNMSVNAVAFYSSRAQTGTSDQQIRDLLKEYASRTTKLKYEIVNPDQDPVRATQYGITRIGSVVFDSGQKREIANSITEADFTGALVRLMQTGIKTVAFLTGHGERSITTSGGTGEDYMQVNQAIQKDNYNTLAWNLAITPTIPVSDVSVLVIAEPRQAYNPTEMKAIQSYLDGGGHVLLLLDPEMPPEAQDRFTPMLQKYGITAVHGGVVDRASSYSRMGVGVVLVTTYPSGSPITRDIASSNLTTIFPLSLGFKPPTSTVGGMQVTSIIQSSGGTLGDKPASWLETDLTSQTVKFDEGKDIQGPVSMALSAEPQDQTASSTLTATTTVKPRLVVYGDADFPSTSWLQQDPSNLDLFANSISWLAGANELVSIRAKAPDAPRTVTLSTGQQSVLFFSTVVGLPLLIILMGAFIWWRRR